MAIKTIVQQQYQGIIDSAAPGYATLKNPPEGWLQTVRKALGMSGAQLAKKMGLTRARVAQAEHAELDGGVTLKSMQAFAEAMGCRFVYAIVPAKAHRRFDYGAGPKEGRGAGRDGQQAYGARKPNFAGRENCQGDRTSHARNRARHGVRFLERLMPEGIEYPEGATPLDPDELGGLKFKHITTREQLDELEQANIESGLRWLARHRGDVLTDDFAMTLHRRLFGDVWDWAGSLRRTDKNIGIDPLQISVEFAR